MTQLLKEYIMNRYFIEIQFECIKNTDVLLMRLMRLDSIKSYQHITGNDTTFIGYVDAISTDELNITKSAVIDVIHSMNRGCFVSITDKTITQVEHLL